MQNAISTGAHRLKQDPDADLQTKVRRISTLFTPTHFWKNYDVFARQKMATFRSSRPAVLELAAKYKELVTQLEEEDKAGSKNVAELQEAEKILFTEMLEICLWGNATDLSLLTSLTYEDIQKLQGSKARKEAEKNVLVNDIPAAYKALKEAQKTKENQTRRIDIVLDNAGFELFVDLILAGYLLSAGLATHVILHPKSIPWFVSDVLPADFGALLNALADPQSLYSSPSDEDAQAGKKPDPLSDKEASDLSFLFQHWSGFHQGGQLIMRPNRFWTHAGSYWRLPQTEPNLFRDLKESELVVFKGDLNYRKLTGDVCLQEPASMLIADKKQAMWETTTPFATAIGPLGPGSGVRVLALRTCKADVVVGLTVGITEELEEKLNATDGGVNDSGARKWAWSGKWALVQFSDGKS